jgi:hypothetical protein
MSVTIIWPMCKARADFDLSESKGDSLGLRFLIQNPCW